MTCAPDRIKAVFSGTEEGNLSAVYIDPGNARLLEDK